MAFQKRKRIKDPDVLPLDSDPIISGRCPLCRELGGGPVGAGAFAGRLQRVHLVGKGSGGDDVPENLIWACADCHECLHLRNKGAHGLTYALVAERLIRYCRDAVPEVGAYTDRAKFDGWLEWYYAEPKEANLF